MEDKERASGRTTRLADSLIQELFKNGECIVKDHFDSRMSSLNLCNIIRYRLINEHRDNATFEFKNDTYIMKLKR